MKAMAWVQIGMVCLDRDCAKVLVQDYCCSKFIVVIRKPDLSYLFLIGGSSLWIAFHLHFNDQEISSCSALVKDDVGAPIAAGGLTDAGLTHPRCA
jgi:hypothetical protein